MVAESAFSGDSCGGSFVGKKTQDSRASGSLPNFKIVETGIHSPEA